MSDPRPDLRSERAETLVPSVVAMDSRRPARRRWFVGVGAAAAAVLAIVVPMATLGDQAKSPASSSPSITESAGTINPHLLLDAPRWSVQTVIEDDRSDELTGHLTYTNGPTSLEVSWQPVSQYREVYADTEAIPESGNPARTTFLGQDAVLWDLGTGNGYRLLARIGPAAVSVSSARAPDRNTFRQYLGSLTQVTPQAWFDAMPASVVVPAESATEAARMLEGTPLPEGLADSAFSSDLANNYTAFAGRGLHVVTCAWLDDYEKAHDRGDQEGMAKATEALNSAPDWPLLQISEEEAGWSVTVASYSEEMAAGKDVVGTLNGGACEVEVN